MQSDIAKRTSAALLNFQLDQHHLTVWDPNELVTMGFPAEVVLSGTSIFKRKERYLLYFLGEEVDEFIGVVHYAFVAEIAKAADRKFKLRFPWVR
jgi:hypothetical protein